MEKKNVVVYIAGQRFSLTTDDSAEYINGLAEKIDADINTISKANPKLNRDGCATLCALSLWDDQLKLSKKLDTLEEQLKAYLKDADNLRVENDILKSELENLKKAKAKEVEVKPAPTPAVSIPSDNNKRQLAFSGKDFRADKKKRHNHDEMRNKNNKPWLQKNEEKPTPAMEDLNEKGLPEEPPFQYSIFDTDFM